MKIIIFLLIIILGASVAQHCDVVLQSGSNGNEICRTINECSTTMIALPQQRFNSSQETFVIEFTSSCVITRPTVTILCNDSSFVLDCSETDDQGCFHVQEDNSVFSLVGCSLRGAGVVVNVTTGGNVSILHSSFDGNNLQIPIHVYTVGSVNIQHTSVRRGMTKSLWVGGACMSLRGVRGEAVLNNVTVRHCSSGITGGCVLVNGDNFVGVIESRTVPGENYGDRLVITSSLFEYCSTSGASGGLLTILYMNSLLLADTIFRHGIARTYEGCIRFGATGPGEIRLSNIVVTNCTAGGEGNGCLSITPYDGPLQQHSPLYVENVTMSDCFSKKNVGAISVKNTNRLVFFSNVYVHNAHSTSGAV
eukprot:PhF_6_TR44207/c0_g1_i1/m.67879